MLSPVRASQSSEFVLASQLAQDGEAGASPRDLKAEAALALLKSISSSQAGVKLAGLLGHAELGSGDVLTNLALNFAKSLNLQPQPNESLKAFTARIAETILSLSALERVAAESKSGLMALGISASSLAAALKNPTSADAARLVALIETKLESPRDSAVKTAISNYQALAGREQGPRNMPGNGQPVLPEAPQSPPRNPVPNGRGVEVLRLLQANKDLANGAPAGATQQPSRSPVQIGAATPEQIKVRAAAADMLAQSQPVSARGANIEVRQPVEEAKVSGFMAREAVLAAKSGSAILTNAAPVVAGQSAAHLATLTANPAPQNGRSAHVIDFVRAVMARAENQEAVTAAAYRVAAALANRQILLFTGSAPSEGTGEDLEKQISRALGDAARASQAAAAGLAAADHAQQNPLAQPHVGIPFAQVPYPQADTEEARRKAKEDQQEGEEGREEDDARGEGNEQSMQGEGEAGDEPKRRPPEEPVNDNPFAADEPLDRHASDADRAYHMYQKFGGF
ncbi:hypothetical protein [Rhizobium sp. L1K21]|uniref:hypothetical protein n=1 Tax=Rhizobium sp. L1K21 TaxID=2954933 RepID=UPI0020939D1E|nr:hypothetical protein [Rhizobium sp. L1K21]MCO6185547.1 hypothetical protein [Rhizobium sp. L1K21]